MARLLQPALWVLIGMTACGKATDPLPDKNTNWLRVCTEDEACGEGLSCLCGACTRACEETSECERAASGASCHAVSDDGLQARCEAHPADGASAVCMTGCSSDAECQASVGDDASCEAGLCVRTKRASSPAMDATGDADPSEQDPSEPNEFEAFVADHRDCESVADYILIMPGCRPQPGPGRLRWPDPDGWCR